MITLDGIKNIVLALAGNVFIIIFVIRAVGAYAKREWGELVTNILAAILIAGFIYFNDSTINILKWIWGQVTGGGH